MQTNTLTAAHREYGRKNANAAIDRGDTQAEFKSVMDALAARDAEIKTFAEKASAEIKDHGKILGDTKSALEKITREGSELQARLMEVEQKLARRGGPANDNAGPSLGAQFTDSAEFKALAQRGKGSARIQVKAVTNLTSTTSGTGGVGSAIRPDRRPGILTPPERPLTIRDLILPGRTESNAIEYVKESGFQNSAAPVAEGAAKPQSDLAFTLVTTNVRTLAHWVRASRQVLSDIPQLQSYVDQRLLYGLRYVEEAQILGGDGTGQNLLGLIPQATAYAFGTYSVSGDTIIDRLRRAIAQVRIAEYRASAIVLNPADWTSIQLMKDSTGQYIWSDPAIQNGQNLWGLPVVDTNAMTAGKFMLGAFNMAGQIFDREDAAVEVSTEDQDNFIKNMVTILAEERLALAVYRPESFVYGNLVAGNAS